MHPECSGGGRMTRAGSSPPGVPSGDEAVAAARRVRRDVVLMDLRLPGTDGLAATRRLLAVLPEDARRRADLLVRRSRGPAGRRLDAWGSCSRATTLFALVQRVARWPGAAPPGAVPGLSPGRVGSTRLATVPARRTDRSSSVKGGENPEQRLRVESGHRTRHPRVAEAAWVRCRGGRSGQPGARRCSRNRRRSRRQGYAGNRRVWWTSRLSSPVERFAGGHASRPHTSRRGCPGP